MQVLERMIGVELNNICESFFHSAETGYTQPEEECNDREAEQESGDVNGAFSTQNAPAETVDYAHHGIETI